MVTGYTSGGTGADASGLAAGSSGRSYLGKCAGGGQKRLSGVLNNAKLY